MGTEELQKEIIKLIKLKEKQTNFDIREERKQFNKDINELKNLLEEM